MIDTGKDHDEDNAQYNDCRSADISRSNGCCVSYATSGLGQLTSPNKPSGKDEVEDQSC